MKEKRSRIIYKGKNVKTEKGVEGNGKTNEMETNNATINIFLDARFDNKPSDLLLEVRSRNCSSFGKFGNEWTCFAFTCHLSPLATCEGTKIIKRNVCS